MRRVWWQWLFPVGGLAVVAGLWFGRKRIGRGPLAAVLFFAVTLFPALGFVNVYSMRYSFVADHFQYLAGAGLIALAAAVKPAAGGWEFTVSACRAERPACVIGPQLLLLALAGLTWQQTHVYRDLETLWRDTLAKNPGCWLAHNNLGLVLTGREGRRR